MDDSELDLMRAIGNGDHLAFKCLVRRFQNPLVNFIFRYTGDRCTAEDLTQEVFLRVYQAAPRFEPRANVSTWVFKIAYNLSMNELKRRRRRGFLDHDQQGRREGFDVQAPSDPIQGWELEQEVMTALSQVPENQRAALLLRINNGLSYQEISEVLGVSVSSVESLIFRARKHLRQVLNPTTTLVISTEGRNL
jgi:RNA polymerase sigma-70 factor (ECF subfamily)